MKARVEDERKRESGQQRWRAEGNGVENWRGDERASGGRGSQRE